MATKKYLDDVGLQYLIDNYIINKQICTTKGDILYVSTTATSGSPGTVVYSRLGIGSSGQVLKVFDGLPVWANESGYNLPLAANGTRGGIQIGYATSGKNYAVQLSSEKAYVNVPWTDTNKWHSPNYTTGLEIGEGKNDLDGSDLYVPYASDTQYGVVKAYYAKPASDPTVQAVSTTAGKYYGIQVDSNGKMFVNVPWSNTTYGSDRGISLVNGNFGHSNTSITAQATQGLYPIAIDAYGHITSYGARVSSLPNPEAFTFGTYGTGSQAEDYDGYAAMSLKFDIDCFETEWTDAVDLTVTLNSITNNDIDNLFVSGYTVTIHLSATVYDYSLSLNTLTIDGVDYYVNGQMSLQTDYTDNDTQITANSISCSSSQGGFRWKDSNNSSWTNVNVGGTKSWTLSSNNFEIWIDVNDDN